MEKGGFVFNFETGKWIKDTQKNQGILKKLLRFTETSFFICKAFCKNRQICKNRYQRDPNETVDPIIK